MLGITPFGVAPFADLGFTGVEHIGEASTSVTATNSILGVRVHYFDPVSETASSSNSAVSYRVREGALSPQASVTNTASIERVREADAQEAATVTATSTIERVRELALQIDVTSSIVANGRFTVRGYGSASVAGTMVDPTVERARYLEAATSVSNTVSAAATRVREAYANPSVSVTTVCLGRFTARGYGQADAALSIDYTPTRVRVVSAIDIAEATSGVLAVAREKWEPIVDNDVSGFWTEVA
jgi:hypothetical protein